MKNGACRIAIENVKRGAREDLMQIKQVEWDVLRIALIKDPYFAICGGHWDTMAIIVKQNTLLLGSAAQRGASATKDRDSRIRS